MQKNKNKYTRVRPNYKKQPTKTKPLTKKQIEDAIFDGEEEEIFINADESTDVNESEEVSTTAALTLKEKIVEKQKKEKQSKAATKNKKDISESEIATFEEAEAVEEIFLPDVALLKHKIFKSKSEILDLLKYTSEKICKSICGKNFLNDPGMDYKKVKKALNDNRAFDKISSQEFSVPFSNEMFEALLKLPKYPVRNGAFIKHSDKFTTSNVVGNKFIGLYNGKPLVFSLSVIIPKTTKYAEFERFNIDFDVNINGLQWLPLLRLDYNSFQHTNYTKEGAVIEDKNKVKQISASHIHKNSNLTQILCNKSEYLEAEDIDTSKIGEYPFKTCLDRILKEANLNISVNKNIEQNYFFDDKYPLFLTDMYTEIVSENNLNSFIKTLETIEISKPKNIE